MKNISKHIGESPETHCLNYIPITERVASSGQPTPLQIEAIAVGGYRHIINLAMHDSSDALFEEGGLVSEVGMNYFHIPVPFDAPSIEHLRLFLNLLEMTKEDKVWVHCAYNWRASAFLSHYQRIVLKRSEDDLKMAVLEQWQMEDVWKDFLKLDVSA